MVIVITGASGFIGRHLHAWLASHGHEVVGAARSSSSTRFVPFELHSQSFRDLLGRRPDVLVHAAGAASVNDSFINPTRDFQSNTALYLDVLEAIRQVAPACRVVLVSSAAVYGNPTTRVVAESASIAPISPYGYHKAMAEQHGLMYHRVFGLKTCAVRVFSAYGRGLRRQVVYDAIQMLRAARPDRPAVFRGTGREARDFIHVEDVSRGIDAVIHGAQWTGEAYNLANGVSTTIAELVEIVRSELDAPAATFDGVTERGHPLAWQADISRIRTLGFKSSWTLDRGIADLVSTRDWDELTRVF